MKTATKSLFFIALGILFSTDFDAEQAFVATQKTTPTTQKKKLLLFGVKGSTEGSCLLYPDLTRVKGGSFGALLGLTPDVVQKELFDTLRSLNVDGIQGYTGTYPMLVEAWLTNQMPTEKVQYWALQHVKNSCGFMKKMRLKPAAEIAFSPYDAANALSVNHNIVSLVQRCKANGHTVAVCTSWNSECFQAVKNTHYSAFSPFDAFYISGDCGMLACEGRFYDQFLKTYAAEDIYLIDSLQENLTAANQKGIKTIYCGDANGLEYELRKQGIL